MPRIPPKDTSEYPWYVQFLFWLQKKRLGKILTSALIWGRSPKLYLAFARFWTTIDRKNSPLDPQLRVLLNVKISQMNHCQFCVNLSSPEVVHRGGSKEKLNDIENYKESPLYSDAEKIALQYAEAVVQQKVTDKIFNELQNHYSNDQIIELTALISFQTCSNLFNTALDI